MCLNHPDLVHKHPALPCFPCNDVHREGSVQSNHPEHKPLYTLAILCEDVVRVGSRRFDVLEPPRTSATTTLHHTEFPGLLQV